MIALTHPHRQVPAVGRRTHRVLSWLPIRMRRPDLTRDAVGNLSIVTLTGDASANQQRRALSQMIRQVPVSQTRVLLDVSRLHDEDWGLPRLIWEAVETANRCRLELCVTGLSLPKKALLELTRITRVVRLFTDRHEAVCALLSDRPRNQDSAEWERSQDERVGNRMVRRAEGVELGHKKSMRSAKIAV